MRLETCTLAVFSLMLRDRADWTVGLALHQERQDLELSGGQTEPTACTLGGRLGGVEVEASPTGEMPDLAHERGGAELVGAELVAPRQRRLGVLAGPGLEQGFALAPPGVGRRYVPKKFPSLGDLDPAARVEQTLDP